MTRVMWLALLVACNGGTETETSSVDTDSDTDADTDSDTDADTDSDTDADTDSDTDADTDTDAPVEIISTEGGRTWADGSLASSCRTYLTPPSGYAYAGATGDGTYRIDPDGSGAGVALTVLCDMTTDGGGWTQIAQARGVTDSALSLCATGAVGILDLGVDTVSGPAKLSDQDIAGIWAGGPHNLRMQGEIGVNVTAPAGGWDTSCVLDFVDTQTFTSASGGTWALDTNTVMCPAERTVSAPYAERDTCGYGYQLTNGSYMIWSYDPDYLFSCGNITPTAGRSWPGSNGNNGCNTSKTWVR